MSDLTHREWKPKMKAVLASGIALAMLALLTAATTTQQFDSVTILDGTKNTFELQVSGSTSQGWTPGSADWASGDDNGYVLTLQHGEDVIVVGSPFTARIAVRNASPVASAGIAMSLVNPAKNSQTDMSTDFFDELRFTVTESGRPIMEGIPAPALGVVALPGVLKPGGIRLLDLEIFIDHPIFLNPANARAEVQVQFAGESL